jgi:hypothetical protein
MIALLACTAILPLVASRHAPFFALAAAVFAGEHVGDAWNRWLPERRPPESAVSNISWLSKFGFVVAVALIGFAIQNFWCIRIDPQVMSFPAGPVALLKQSHASGNLAVHFDWGEYVLWHLGPRIRVSVDGRRETVYSGTTYARNLDFIRGLGDWDAILQRQDTHFVLISKEFPVFNLMKMKQEWRLVYEDFLTGLFVREDLPWVEILAAQARTFFPDRGGRCFP